MERRNPWQDDLFVAHTAQTETGYRVSLDCGSYADCDLIRDAEGSQLLVDYIRVPDLPGLRQQGRGSFLYKSAVRHGLAQGADSLFVAIQHPAILRAHFRVFEEGMSHMRRITPHAQRNLGRCGLETATIALRALDQEAIVCLYTQVDLTDPSTAQHLNNTLLTPPLAGNS